MAEPHVFQKGPLVQKMDPGAYWFCACGHSQTQPMCDGSHRGTGLAPIQIKIDVEKQVAWCGCKHSEELPFCDGAHRTLRD